MGLITNIKFGEVDNLSDARFAAGSEATFIGFPFDQELDIYLEPKKAKEIISWINGPIVVGEFGRQDLDEINQAIQDFNLDFVQLNEATNYFSHQDIKAKIIQNIDLATFRGPEEINFYIEEIHKNVAFFMLSLYDEEEYEEYFGEWENEKLVNELSSDLNVILNFPFDPDNILPVVKNFNPYGINLYPGGEEKPGLKDFDELIDMVEDLKE